ncbi:dnaJ homolog subfamily C member 2-like [Zophobas morio]|uniref:dnaJ homolog subfamily C member 2-like n=1 Tax=Zophobas morio TaxID=2755281 RepID=UPI003083E149
MLYLDSPLPALPSVWSLDEKKVSPIAERLLVRVEPVGFAFERLTQQASLVSSLDNESETATTKKKEDNDIFNKYFEPLNLVGLNPSSWKKQDHYEILGLHKLRYLATEENINRAYKALVLKHHPDKKKKLPDGSDDDSYFKCLKIGRSG